MKLLSLRGALAVLCIASAGLSLASCNSESGDPLPVNVISIGSDGGVVGCSQPNFPDEQPDMSPLAPPQFVTETGEPERLIRPGSPLMAEITVNAATRRVVVELAFAWSPEVVIVTEELETSGNQTIPLTLLPGDENRGRFFMRITLCGLDCDQREVVFDLIDPDPDDPTTGINADYERTLIENGVVIQVDQTCIEPSSVLIQ